MNFRGLSPGSPLPFPLRAPNSGRESSARTTGLVLEPWARPGQDTDISAVSLVHEHGPHLFTPAAPVGSPHRPATKARPRSELPSLWGTVRPCCLLPEWPECTEPSKPSWLPFFSLSLTLW